MRLFANYNSMLAMRAVSGVAGSYVRSLLGRRPPHYRDYVLRLATLIRAGLVDSNCALTCARSDGAGAQAHGRMSIVAFCRNFGIPYFHTPFVQVEHTSSADEVLRWEELFGFNKLQDLPDANSRRSVDLPTFVNSPALWSQKVLVRCLFLHPFVDRNTELYERMRSDFRKCYSGDSEHSIPGTANVAVHIRRGDVGHSKDSNRRFTSNAKVRQAITAVKAACSETGLTPIISIYSQGQEADFDWLQESDCILQLNKDPLWTFNRLVRADALLMAKSSFSYAAALLSNGKVIYEPFWHPPLPSWMPVDSPQDANAVTLTDALRSRFAVSSI